MSEYLIDDVRKITTTRLQEMKQKGQRIAMLTAYDYTTAQLVDGAGMDIILVGDSASNVMAGNDTTLPISLQEMIFYARSVARGTKRAFVVCDMPFGSFQVSPQESVKNAIEVMKQTGVDAVKIEGGEEVLESISAILRAGIPVMAHLGLTPQSIHQFGGYGVRAKEEAEAAKLLADAKKLEAAGCFALVVEKIPAALTKQLCESLHIPVIAIGGGLADGQVLVVQDMLGMNKGFSPKFLRRYADLHTVITNALGQYIMDVKDGSFPNEREQY